MAEEVNLWNLDEAPVMQDRPITEFELLSVQQTMGSGGLRKTVEGRVSLAEPLVFAPPEGVGADSSETNYAYYIVRIPFTLHSLSGDRNYDRFELRVKLKDPAVTGFMLIPDQVITKEDIERTYDLTAGFARAGVNLGGNGSYVVRFTKIAPVVLSFGLSSPEFYWEFKRQDKGPPLVGSQVTLVILRVPKSITTVRADFYAEALIESRFPWIEKESIFSDHKDLEWDFAKAEPIGAIPWTRANIDSLSGKLQ